MTHALLPFIHFRKLLFMAVTKISFDLTNDVRRSLVTFSSLSTSRCDDYSSASRCFETFLVFFSYICWIDHLSTRILKCPRIVWWDKSFFVRNSRIYKCKLLFSIVSNKRGRCNGHFLFCFAKQVSTSVEIYPAPGFVCSFLSSSSLSSFLSSIVFLSSEISRIVKKSIDKRRIVSSTYNRDNYRYVT